MKSIIMKSRQLHTALMVVFSSLIVSIVSCKTPPQNPPPPPPPPSSSTNLLIATTTSLILKSNLATKGDNGLKSPKASETPSAKGPPNGSNPPANEPPPMTPAGRPRVQSIGDASPIQQFERGHELSIPIRGQDLKSQDSEIAVDVQPAALLVPGVDYFLDCTSKATTESLIFLKFSSWATTNFHTGQRFRVSINISKRPLDNGAVRNAHDMADLMRDVLLPDFTAEQKSNIQSGKIDANLARLLGRKAQAAYPNSTQLNAIANLLKELQQPPAEQGASEGNPSGQDRGNPGAFNEGISQAQALVVAPSPIKAAPQAEIQASIARTFVLYTSDDYERKVESGLIGIENLAVYPLNETEAKKMFGGFVARNFYVIRLTIHNPTTNDQIVGLGAIKAYGAAMVKTDPTNSGPYFTVPIELVPQSEQQIYTLVQNTKSGLSDADSIRDWVFGGLDLIGVMASAYGTAFGASSDYVKAVALTTGTGFPALGKLWEDKRPFHLMNINNFAMADVVKIPKGGGSLDEKYIFFSKGRILGVIQDPYITGIRDWEKYAKPRQEWKRFGVKPISVAFESLQIPFETTYLPAENLVSNTPPKPRTAPQLTVDLTNEMWVAAGKPVNLSVTATGDQLSYQWFFNTNTVPNQTTNSFHIDKFAATNAGTYFVRITNAFGYTNSSNAVLHLADPVITLQPTNQIVALGSNGTFRVEAEGAAPLSYQWYFKQTNALEAQTNKSLTVSEPGTYSVTVTNRFNKTNSNPASLTHN